MEFNIPPEIIENFCFSNFEAKYNSSGEIHFNSPMTFDTKKRLYVSPEMSVFFDQKRQIGGSFLSFVSEFLNVSKREALNILIRDYSSKQSNNKNEYKKIIQSNGIKLPKGTIFFLEANKNSRTYKLAKNYLNSRGIPLDELAYVYDPQGDLNSEDSYNNRIIVPFYEEEKLVYFIARTFEKNNPLRYKNPKGLDSGNFVFQIDKLKDDVFIFEGVFDALSLHEPQVGTAMLSNKLKMPQIIKILNKAPKRIIFVTENDKNEEAIKAGKRNLEWNLKTMMRYKPPSLNIEFYIFNPPYEYKDFNEYSYKTGKHFIDIETECKKWEPGKIDINVFDWGKRKELL